MLDHSCQYLNLYAGVKSIFTKKVSNWLPARATSFHVILDGKLLLWCKFKPFSCWGISCSALASNYCHLQECEVTPGSGWGYKDIIYWWIMYIWQTDTLLQVPETGDLSSVTNTFSRERFGEEANHQLEAPETGELYHMPSKQVNPKVK